MLIFIHVKAGDEIIEVMATDAETEVIKELMHIDLRETETETERIS